MAIAMAPTIASSFVSSLAGRISLIMLAAPYSVVGSGAHLTTEASALLQALLYIFFEQRLQFGLTKISSRFFFRGGVSFRMMPRRQASPAINGKVDRRRTYEGESPARRAPTG